MNKVALLFVGMMCCSAIASQSLMKPQDKVFNLGVKAGMRSIYPDISSIELGGTNVSVEDIRFKHYVGYTAELMMRVNIDRFFIQPSASWNISQADILFDVLLPVSENMEQRVYPQSITMRIKSLEVPVVVGYHLVKENPYVLSVMSGIKMKYNYDVRFTSNELRTSFLYNDDSLPFHWALYGAMEVVIGKLTFGVGYEYGLRRIHSNFDSFSYRGESETSTPMHISKRLNGLSMSVGIIF